MYVNYIILTFLYAADALSTVSTLADRNARQEWEKIFNHTYIQPILEVQLQSF